MKKKNLELLTNDELANYAKKCFEINDNDEALRVILEFDKRGMGQNDSDYLSDQLSYERAEQKMKTIGKLNVSEFKNLNTFELQFIISNESNIYLEKESRKALEIFINKKKAMPNYSDDDPDMLWAKAMKKNFVYAFRFNLFLKIIPLIIPFGFLFQQVVIRKREFSTFNLGVFGVLLIMTIGYLVINYRKKK